MTRSLLWIDVCFIPQNKFNLGKLHFWHFFPLLLQARGQTVIVKRQHQQRWAALSATMCMYECLKSCLPNYHDFLWHTAAFREEYFLFLIMSNLLSISSSFSTAGGEVMKLTECKLIFSLIYLYMLVIYHVIYCRMMTDSPSGQKQVS